MLSSTSKKTTPLLSSLFQTSTYVNLKQKGKHDSTFDSIPLLTKSRDLRLLLPLISLLSSSSSSSTIPISLISKRRRHFELTGRVISFLRKYPSIFHQFPDHNNHPHFQLTPHASSLHQLQRSVLHTHRFHILNRLRRIMLMSPHRMLPFTIVQGLCYYIGLPDNFLEQVNKDDTGLFDVVEVDGKKQLKAVVDCNEPMPLSAIQRSGNRILTFPSRGLRLKQKIKSWNRGFEQVDYVSPYEDFSALERGSDVFEKRVVGVLHELLSLFVDGSAERRRILCLRKHLGLPQRFDKCFERHPHVFYLLLKNKSCFVVLKEAYCGGVDSGIERHPMLEVREKYVELMVKSEEMLRRRRSGKPLKEDVDCGSREEFSEVMEEESLQKA